MIRRLAVCLAGGVAVGAGFAAGFAALCAYVDATERRETRDAEDYLGDPADVARVHQQAAEWTAP